MPEITGDLIRKLHLHPYGPCKTPDETAAVLQKAMEEFDIKTALRAAHFLGQVCLESNEFSQLLEDGTGQEYEGRLDLGNVSLGDGTKYKGRGYIQLTGRHNYAMMGPRLRLDLINNPDLLLEPENAARSAGCYWMTAGLNQMADERKLLGITKIINGGYNNLRERTFYTNVALKNLGLDPDYTTVT